MEVDGRVGESRGNIYIYIYQKGYQNRQAIQLLSVIMLHDLCVTLCLCSEGSALFHINVMSMKDNGDITWLKFDETNSIFSDCIYVCLCYNVSSGTSRQGLFDRLLSWLLHIEQIKADSNDFNYSFLICGDFNARVRKLKDFVSGDNNRYIDALPDEYISDTNIRRVTQDKTVKTGITWSISVGRLAWE